RRVSDDGHQRALEARGGTAADRDGSSQASVIRGRVASDEGRSTASRTKVTPSGSVASARIRQTWIGPLMYAWAGGNAGTGSPAASASARCWMYASTVSGVAFGNARRT